VLSISVAKHGLILESFVGLHSLLTILENPETSLVKEFDFGTQIPYNSHRPDSFKRRPRRLFTGPMYTSASGKLLRSSTCCYNIRLGFCEFLPVCKPGRARSSSKDNIKGTSSQAAKCATRTATECLGWADLAEHIQRPAPSTERWLSQRWHSMSVKPQVGLHRRSKAGSTMHTGVGLVAHVQSASILVCYFNSKGFARRLLQVA